MLVKPLVHFSTTSLGTFEPGAVAEIPDSIAEQFIAKGYVEKVSMEIKPKSEALPKEHGAAKEPLSQQAAPALQKKPAAKRVRKSTK